MVSHRIVLTLGACLLAAALVAGGQPQNKPRAAVKAPLQQSKEQDSESLDVDYASGHFNDATHEGEGTKFVAVDKDTTVSADRAKWNSKTKIAEATGNLKMTDPQADATGEKALVYYARNKKLLVITGNVQITIKPKDKSASESPAPVKVEDNKAVVKPASDDEEQSARKHPALVTCDKVEYLYHKDKKHGLLTGNFKVVQKLTKLTRTLTAEHAEWFGKEEKIILFPPVHYSDSDGSTGEPKGQVTVYTKEGEERMENPEGGKFHYIVKDEDEEKPPAKKKQ